MWHFENNAYMVVCCDQLYFIILLFNFGKYMQDIWTLYYLVVLSALFPCFEQLENP
jgi:hypothetical protein